MSETTETATVAATPPVGETVTPPAAMVTPEATPAATSPETAPVPPPAEVSPETPPATGVAPAETPPAATTETPAAETGSEAVEPTAPAYTDFTFPEGAKLDAELIGQAKEVFGKHGLTQEAAQELVDLHNSSAQKVLEAWQAQATDYWAGKSKEWVQEIENDPQVGGNRLNTSTELARAALSDGLSDADKTRLWNDLTDTKIGDHPVLFKRMAQLGRERQQVLEATGTTTWAAALKKIREPASPPPGQAVRGNGATRPADRRYQPPARQ